MEGTNTQPNQHTERTQSEYALLQEAIKPYAEDPHGFFTHNEGGNGHIFGYEMKVSKKKVDWAETQITVHAPSNTLNRLTIMWNGRKISIEGDHHDELNVFVNGAGCDVSADLTPITWENMRGEAIPQGIITLKTRKEESE